MTLRDRRRALMAEPQWELMDFPITNFSNKYLETYSKFGADSVRVYNTTAYQYRNIWADFTTEPGYEYRYTVTVSVTNGQGKIMCRSGSTAVAGTYSSTYASGTNDVDIVFDHNAKIDKITLFCTYTTSSAGDVTFSKFRLYRRRKKIKVLYQMLNWTFTGGNLDTGIPLCETDSDFTIAYDVTTTTNPDSGDGSKFRLLRIIDAAGSSYALSVHKATGSATKLTFRFMDQVYSAGIGSTAPGRHRFVITHDKGSDKATIKYRNDNGSAETAMVSATFAATTKNLVLGQSSGENQLPSGTLNNLTVYSGVLSTAEIDAFLGL